MSQKDWILQYAECESDEGDSSESNEADPVRQLVGLHFSILFVE